MTENTNTTAKPKRKTQKQWEIGVRLTSDHDQWKHYHPIADSEDTAKRLVIESATGTGKNAIASQKEEIEIFMVEGPFKPSNPAEVNADDMGEIIATMGDGSDK